MLLSEAATDFATFLSLNSNQPSVKHLPLFPPYFLRRLRLIGSTNGLQSAFYLHKPLQRDVGDPSKFMEATSSGITHGDGFV